MEQQPEKQDLLAFFKVLGDADRLKIAGLLAAETLTITQLTEKLSLPPTEVHKHLQHLESLGLLQKTEKGFHLNENALEGKARAVLAQSRPRPNREAYDGDDFERKTLADYIGRDGMLKAIPTQQKKLLVILRHLVKSFEMERRYPEKEVNEIIWKFHEDNASLRRYMVDFGLMAREKGIYWRTPEMGEKSVNEP